MSKKTSDVNILEIFKENADYENCNIEFEPMGASYTFVDFHPIVELQEQLNAVRKLFKGEWVDTEIICKALDIDFSTGLRMFDFSRQAQWCKPPLNGQIVTTKFKRKEEKRDD